MVDNNSDRTFQLLIWGYAIEGDVLEHDALLAEGESHYRTQWDFTRHQLNFQAIDRGNGFERVPDWWGLRHLPMEWREAQYARDVA
jgi:hypothetical protein